MTHPEIQDRLEAYVDDRLNREERREVDRRVAADVTSLIQASLVSGTASTS